MKLSEYWKEAGEALLSAAESLTLAAAESLKAGFLKLKEVAEKKKAAGDEKERKAP